MLNTEDQKATATNADLLLIMRNRDEHKTAARNAYLLLIMRNPEQQKARAKIADLHLNYAKILKSKKQLQQMQIYF